MRKKSRPKSESVTHQCAPNAWKPKRFVSPLLSLAYVLAISYLGGGSLFAQTTASESWKELIVRLDDDRLAIRNETERKLIDIGPEFSRWLDEIGAIEPYSSESMFRLQRIRERIFDNAVESATQPSTISPLESIDATQLITAIWEQSGNRVELPEISWQTNESLSFWNAIDSICEKNKLAIDVQATRTRETNPGIVLSRESESLQRPSIATNQGVLHVVWLGNPNTEATQVRLRMYWEPRLQLIGIRVPMADVSTTNANNEEWGVFNKDAVYNIPPPASRSFTDIRLPIRQGENGQSKLTQVDFPVELKVIGPNANCTFRDFLDPSLNVQTQHFGMASISLENIQSDSAKTLVQVKTRYDRTKMAQPLQSHIDWSRFCDAKVRLMDGQTMTPLEVRQIQQQPWSYTIEYLFPAPGQASEAADLIFRIPSGIISITEKITLSPAGH